MIESPPPTGGRGPKTFSVSYRLPIVCALCWIGLLAIWCALVLDMGESLQAYGYALGVYLALVLIIMVRRPTTPSSFDLLLVGWALPILFFTLLLLFPLAWHLRGIR